MFCYSTNQEEILAIKKMTPDHKLPMFTLMGGSDAIHAEWQKFHAAKISDYKNEGFPKNSRRLSMKTMSKLNLSK